MWIFWVAFVVVVACLLAVNIQPRLLSFANKLFAWKSRSNRCCRVKTMKRFNIITKSQQFEFCSSTDQTVGSIYKKSYKLEKLIVPLDLKPFSLFSPPFAHNSSHLLFRKINWKWFFKGRKWVQKSLNRVSFTTQSNITKFRVQVILLGFILGACMLLKVNAKPLENDSAEIVMKIEKVNEQLPGNKRQLLSIKFLFLSHFLSLFNLLTSSYSKQT